MSNRRTILTSMERQSAVAGWQASLRQAAFNAINADDVRQIVEGMVKKAKEGDVAATKVVFELFLGGKQSLTQNNVVIEALPEKSTDAPPGSRRKIDELAARARNGKALFHPADGAEA